MIMTQVLVKCLPVFRDTNHESKKKHLTTRGLGTFTPNDCNLPFLLDLSLELAISEGESVKKNMSDMPVV